MPLRLVPAALLVFFVLVAGCAVRPEAMPSTGPVTDAPTAAEQPNATVPTAPVGTLDARVNGEGRTDYNLTGCLDPRMLFVLDPAKAQALLPPGYHAADVGALLPFAGLPPPGIPAGRAVGGYDLLSCNAGSLNGTPAHPTRFSQVGILVDAPDLGARSPTGNATINLYLLALNTDDSAWANLLHASGFSPEEARLATIASALQETPAAGQGTGQVSSTAMLASVDYALTANGRTLDLQGRYWHTSSNGTFYLDFHLGEEVRAGPILSCTHAAGSAYAAVSGTTACAAEPRFAAVGVGAKVAGTAYWLPGVFPK